MKLLPCPCCGSSDIYAGVAHAFGYHVKCNDCGLRTRDFNLPDLCGKKNLPQRLTFDAMEAWNMRQPSLHNAIAVAPPTQQHNKQTKHNEDNRITISRRK